MQAPLLGTEHVQLVGKDVAFVIDDPHTERVGGPLDSQSDHAPLHVLLGISTRVKPA